MAEGKVESKWYVVDADGKVLGRLATRVASMLRGKHKPQYTPYLDFGDHIVIINRVKPHTKFRADIESGLCKMLTIGLGKSAGAVEFHRRAVQQTFKIIEDTLIKHERLEDRTVSVKEYRDKKRYS